MLGINHEYIINGSAQRLGCTPKKLATIGAIFQFNRARMFFLFIGLGAIGFLPRRNHLDAKQQRGEQQRVIASFVVG